MFIALSVQSSVSFGSKGNISSILINVFWICNGIAFNFLLHGLVKLYVIVYECLIIRF